MTFSQIPLLDNAQITTLMLIGKDLPPNIEIKTGKKLIKTPSHLV